MSYDQNKLVWQFFADELSKVAMPKGVGMKSGGGKSKGMSPAALQRSIMRSNANSIKGFQRTSAAVLAPPPSSTINNKPTIYMGGTP